MAPILNLPIIYNNKQVSHSIIAGCVYVTGLLYWELCYIFIVLRKVLCIVTHWPFLAAWASFPPLQAQIDLSVLMCLLTTNLSINCFWQGYTPTVQDVLLARKATKGISEHEFLINDIPFCFVDVGGQRSQRQRWYQCFDNVRSILFLVASSEFDQVLFEDRRTNRLLESCNIFDTIVNNRAFERVSIILFLNKTDLLKEKIQLSDIKHYFPQFKGNSRQLDDVQKFEIGLFDERRVDKSQPLFHHFTTAVDTQNIKFVFQAVKDTILGDHLKTLMLQWVIGEDACFDNLSMIMF